MATKLVTIHGDKALLRAFKTLPLKVQKKVLRQAVRAGAKPILQAAKRDVAVRTGTLKKAMYVKVKRYPDFSFLAIVGPKWGEAKHQHLVERGTGPRVRKSGGSTGTMPADPYMEPALQRAGPLAAAAMTKKLGQATMKEIAKVRVG